MRTVKVKKTNKENHCVYDIHLPDDEDTMGEHNPIVRLNAGGNSVEVTFNPVEQRWKFIVNRSGSWYASRAYLEETGWCGDDGIDLEKPEPKEN